MARFDVKVVEVDGEILVAVNEGAFGTLVLAAGVLYETLTQGMTAEDVLLSQDIVKQDGGLDDLDATLEACWPMADRIAEGPLGKDDLRR